MDTKYLIKKLITIALLASMSYVLTTFLSIKISEALIIGFGVIPIIVCAMLYGGVSAGVCYSIVNLLRVLTSGYALTPWDIPLTALCFLTGIIYGFFLYEKKVTIIRILIPTIVTCLLINLIGNTYFYSKLMGQGFIALIPARVLKNVVMIPINTYIIFTLSKIKPIMHHAKR